MGYNYVVLGAGRQGVAAAYDLALNCEAARLTIADLDVETTRKAVRRLGELLPDTGCDIAGAICDVSKPAEVAMTISGADVVLSAAPYRFNVPLTDAAIAARASFCDLGGNTQVVQHQLKRHERAADAGVSVLPDCGLAPGLVNVLAAHGIASMDEPAHVQMRCGGLPAQPVGPLGYKLGFNFDGLINEYSGFAQVLRGGELVQVAALSELEEIEFPEPVGCCEAAITSGGTSTCAGTYAGRLDSLEYKTVRYPGHFAVMKALFELGGFEDFVTLPDGELIEPRPLLRQLIETRCAFPDVRDVVVFRTTVSGKHAGKPCTWQGEGMDHHDERTGFSAMERTTAFSAALVAYMQARRLVEPGARPLEVALPAQQYLDELPQHDVHVRMTSSQA